MNARDYAKFGAVLADDESTTTTNSFEIKAN